MNRLLLICPSRQRIDILHQMLESVKRTTSAVDVACVVDQDDDVNGYRKMVAEYAFAWVEVNCTRCQGFVGLYNLVFRRLPHYSFYSPTNDDFVYLTENWDEKLIQAIQTRNDGHGWAYGDDMNLGQQLPTTSVVSGVIARKLGWLQLPYVRRFFADNAVFDLGVKTKRIDYVPSVRIEHRHASLGKGTKDSTFAASRGAWKFWRDRLAYLWWRIFQLNHDAEALKILT